MKIKTGKGTIPLITLIAIWSISALTSLPGLAVSPILGDLTKIFPKATDLDIQMLTSLPSLLIIPFILLGGKLTEKVDFVRVLQVGLWLFATSGVLYLLSNKMWQLPPPLRLPFSETIFPACALCPCPRSPCRAFAAFRVS